VSDLELSVEGIGPDVIRAYTASGMVRGQAGPAALSWSFGQRPDAFAVARAKGRVVGVSAYIHTRMTLGPRAEGDAYQAVDSFVDESMRGAGIFTKLARAYEANLLENGGDLVWGFPNRDIAPLWFDRLGWQRFGQAPFLIKPLRAGYFLRKARIPLDFPVASGKDQNLPAVEDIGAWADGLWERFCEGRHIGTVRSRAYLNHRLFAAPHFRYRVVANPDPGRGALVATRAAKKHGTHIGYIMEAIGGPTVEELLRSELARLRDRGAELAFAWSFPWSPNYRLFRKAGFVPFPKPLRPIQVWFGCRPLTPRAAPAADRNRWYLSYLDSDTV